MPPRKRKRAAPTADSPRAVKSTPSKVSRKRESHQNEVEDADDQDKQDVSCQPCGACMTSLSSRELIESILKLTFANQVLKDTILELLRKRKPGSSC